MSSSAQQQAEVTSEPLNGPCKLLVYLSYTTLKCFFSVINKISSTSKYFTAHRNQNDLDNPTHS